MYALVLFYTCCLVAVVGLQQVVYRSSEDTNIEVCVAVTSPDPSIGCPICRGFAVGIETADITASESLKYLLKYM